MELAEGVEPPTYSLQVNCTSIVLCQHMMAVSGGADPHHIPMTTCFQDTVRRRPQSLTLYKSQASIGAIFVSLTYIILLVASGGYFIPALKETLAPPEGVEPSQTFTWLPISNRTPYRPGLAAFKTI